MARNLLCGEQSVTTRPFPHAVPEKNIAMRLFFSVVFTVATALPITGVQPAAAAPQAAIAACLAEAQWPVTHSPAFADGSPRTREALLNGYNPAVSRFSGLCRRIATAPTGDRTRTNDQCQRDVADDKTGADDAARAHLERMAARCAALAG